MYKELAEYRERAQVRRERKALSEKRKAKTMAEYIEDAKADIDAAFVTASASTKYPALVIQMATTAMMRAGIDGLAEAIEDAANPPRSNEIFELLDERMTKREALAKDQGSKCCENNEVE